MWFWLCKPVKHCYENVSWCFWAKFRSAAWGNQVAKPVPVASCTTCINCKPLISSFTGLGLILLLGPFTCQWHDPSESQTRVWAFKVVQVCSNSRWKLPYDGFFSVGTHCYIAFSARWKCTEQSVLIALGASIENRHMLPFIRMTWFILMLRRLRTWRADSHATTPWKRPTVFLCGQHRSRAGSRKFSSRVMIYTNYPSSMWLRKHSGWKTAGSIVECFLSQFSTYLQADAMLFTMFCEDFNVSGKKNSAIPFPGCKLGAKLRAVGPGSDVKEDVFLCGTKS